MSNSKLFQDVVIKLVEFWKERGCIVRQPYNVQVGAGTMNPATILRVLGPGPWNVVYIEPCIRPDDGRFGDNPNRMQMHHQLQVILKPDPGNPQELFLESLQAIGIDPRMHDIRFVEDNWESPAMGAWGLGWEVWLDGQEITQFTYFQQAGAVNLDPVCVELTYGLDRIILALQDKESVWDIDYSDQVKYRDVFLQSEIEHCKYYFNVAGVDGLRAVYDTYERECERCIQAQLAVPAHDYNLKCSHLFNILDTRGAVGVTERTNYFQRMRNKASQISELYSNQWNQVEHPNVDTEWRLAPTEDPYSVLRTGQVAQSGPQTFLLEIGQEELPPDDLEDLLKQLSIAVPEMLDELRLKYDTIQVDGSPRRAAVIITNLQERQTDLDQVQMGPPVDRAFDKDGNPTNAALGFARGLKVAVEELRVVPKGKKQVVCATVRDVGLPTVDILKTAVPKLIAKLRFKKSMRWNSSNVSYSRPLRWFVALFGNQVVPFSYANVTSGHVSRGLRPYNSPPLPITNAETYADTLREHGILLHREERQERIVAQSAALAASLGGFIPEDLPLLNEVTHLVESPTAFVGRFAERYLELPSDVLVAVMRKHQRYFPVYRADGTLISAFIAVRNGDDEHLDVVRRGNEQVVRARFADAEFFYRNDCSKQLGDFIDELDKLTFHSKLGSMKDKLRRLETLTPAIATKLDLSEAAVAVAARAAALSKADLASNMVIEMTSLQGIMGGYYAKMSGESEEVATAIAEHYNGISHTKPGLALAIADRIDSLVGLAAAGLLPNGSSDPFSLRKASIQVIENLIANQVDVNLAELVSISAKTQPIAVSAEVQQHILEFATGRLEVILREKGYARSVVRAVLSAQPTNPNAARIAVAALSEAVTKDDWSMLLDEYARCARITSKEAKRHEVYVMHFEAKESLDLFDAYQASASIADGSVATLVVQIRSLAPVIRTFFEQVFVMDEDEVVRNNHLGLLQSVVALADGIADLSVLEGF